MYPLLMPLPVDRRKAQAMSSRFDEALTLVVNGPNPLESIARRKALLEDTLPDLLSAALPDRRFELETHRQPSRLYGHTLADLIALSTIAELAAVAGTDKFAAARDLLRDSPEAVDLRIEDDGPRKGMWSVAQPQYLAILRRADL